MKLPAKYKPTSKEEFMSPRMREYFRRKLETWRHDILNETDATLEKLRLDTAQEPDLADRAAVESERSVQLRTRDRARKLVSKIEAALQRIDDGSYGYGEAGLSGRELAVHGWIYSLKDGLLRDLNTCVTRADELSSIYRMAVAGG